MRRKLHSALRTPQSALGLVERVSRTRFDVSQRALLLKTELCDKNQDRPTVSMFETVDLGSPIFTSDPFGSP
jgi:hypothetical protein